MPTSVHTIGDALFLATDIRRSEKIWFGFFAAVFATIFVGLLGFLLASTWRFEFRVKPEAGGAAVRYTAWVALGLVPLPGVDVVGVKSVRPAYDGPSRRPVIEIESASGNRRIELPFRWKDRNYDHAWYVNQLISNGKAGTHGERFDGASYAILLFPSLFACTAAYFATAAFHTVRFIADRRTTTLRFTSSVLGIRRTRVAQWSDVTGLRYTHSVTRYKGTSVDHYHLVMDLRHRRGWKIALDVASASAAETEVQRLERYLAG